MPKRISKQKLKMDAMVDYRLELMRFKAWFRERWDGHLQPAEIENILRGEWSVDIWNFHEITTQANWDGWCSALNFAYVDDFPKKKSRSKQVAAATTVQTEPTKGES